VRDRELCWIRWLRVVHALSILERCMSEKMCVMIAKRGVCVTKYLIKVHERLNAEERCMRDRTEERHVCEPECQRERERDV
jgi:hypothetical protein